MIEGRLCEVCPDGIKGDVFAQRAQRTARAPPEKAEFLTHVWD